ncbi:MAG TPA: hypothetical protein VFU60_13090 [Ktedonobacterales bacterium]|nr:hypothetical protein [Ktedonobacterales bacterium]
MSDGAASVSSHDWLIPSSSGIVLSTFTSSSEMSVEVFFCPVCPVATPPLGV